MPTLPFIKPALIATALASTSALAGGSSERVLLIINPSSAESMYLGHYYQFARKIPAHNVLYLDPAATNYASFAGANGNIDALLGTLTNRSISKTIDYIVLASPESFFVNAPGLVSDGCWPVARFSQTSVFASAFIRSNILAGNLSSQESNRFFGVSPTSFSSTTSYLSGAPSASSAARRYFIVASLGYTGPRGNTVGEITSMIDAAVAADGTRPAGKFYFINTTDPIRNVRSPQFSAAVSSLPAGRAEIINGIIPDFRNDCLGVLTGWPDPPIDGGAFTILPGAFCDHLTSYAATFDEPAQTKMSSWIRRGAAATCGTVEEPCNYLGKFPTANLHVLSFSGMSLGEAWFRSMQFFPFQILFTGDPLTRAHATIPSVSATLPSTPVTLPFSFTPTASTTLSGAAIQSIELYIDGVLQSAKAPGAPFTINTAAIPEGHHEVRLLAYDNTAVRTVGSWVGSFTSAAYNRPVTLDLPTTTGTMTTPFTATISTSGTGTVREVRLIHNGRVLAASTSSPATLTVFGRNIGPGKTSVQAEVLYTDGIRSRSEPIPVDIAFTAGTISGQPPIAHSYTKRIQRGTTTVVELPATFDDALANTTFTILGNPEFATMSTGTKGYRVVTSLPNACGPDTILFRVNTPSGQSNTATITLIHDSGPACPADFDDSGGLTANDFQAFLNAYAAASLRCDMNGDCNLNAADFQGFLNAYARGCP